LIVDPLKGSSKNSLYKKVWGRTRWVCSS